MAFTGTCLATATLLRVFEKGNPLSLANAYTAREPSAIKELAQTKVITDINDASTDAPATLPVELKKISMTGTPVAVPAVVSMSPMQKHREIKKMKPVIEPI